MITGVGEYRDTQPLSWARNRETMVMAESVRTMSWSTQACANLGLLLSREWLVTNGLGGFASGSVGGVNTRRYHGILVAALPAPQGRMVMLNQLSEEIRLPESASYSLGGEEGPDGKLDLHGANHLVEFRLEEGLPVWRYEAGGIAVEKRLLMLHEQNTTHVTYALVSGASPVRMKIRPELHFRHLSDPVNVPQGGAYALTILESRYELSMTAEYPRLRLMVAGLKSSFVVDGETIPEKRYRLEAERGYPSLGSVWTPGWFRMELQPGQEATLVISTDSWETITALKPTEARAAEIERRRRLLAAAVPEVQTGSGAEFIQAADQFIIRPVGRTEDAARARAAGHESRTVIAGYHWFTDWGRDTMISLEGLTLTAGRLPDAKYILHTFAHYIRDGLIPNLFPEGQTEGLYHTADATLWYFHALDRYLQVSGDHETLTFLLPRLKDIVEHHIKGTRFGIGVDPSDGLLRQGAAGYQLTWMDAKVGDWVVTPRRGKAVEINALWYNALRLMATWVELEEGPVAAQPFTDRANQVQTSFNRRFWYARGGYLYDVVDGETGDDSSFRPNQVFSFSLPHPVLDRTHWEPVLQAVRQRLLTPVGLRSLAPGEPEYKSKYYGDIRSRDAAYHQGTVWSWLIGPFIDAWLRVYPEARAEARGFLSGLVDHLNEACIGSISEVFDAEPPYTPRGCIAQAWGVAEVLRAWAKTDAKG
jgi:predicted glycogen debranching enzyme